MALHELTNEEIAERLEEYGTSRAYFHEATEEQRQKIARRISIHSVRSEVDGEVTAEEREIFFHLCGRAGIKLKEAQALWDTATGGK